MEDKPIVYRLKEASRLFNETVKRLIRKNGISSTYFYILNYIIKHPNDMIAKKGYMFLFKYEAIYYFSCFTKNGAR